MITIVKNSVECTLNSISSSFACWRGALYGKKDHPLQPAESILSFDEQKNRFRALDEWFLSDHGLTIAAAFLSELNPINHLLQGENILQLGSCGQNTFFSKLKFLRHWLATPYMTSSSTLVTLMNQLPLDKECVDCVIAPLTLEALSGEKSPIDEIDRVLKPMGHVIFFGINPISLWGLWVHKAKETCFGEFNSKTKSVMSIKRAMLHRGYIQCHLSTFYYLPPVKSKKVIEKLEILNEIGKLISPLPAAFYCFVVQKYQENPILRVVDESLEPFRTPSAIPLQPTCRKGNFNF